MVSQLLLTRCLLSTADGQYPYVRLQITSRRTFLLPPSPPRTRMVLQYSPSDGSDEPSGVLKGEMIDSLFSTASLTLSIDDVDPVGLLESLGRALFFFVLFSVGDPVAVVGCCH